MEWLMSFKIFWAGDNPIENTCKNLNGIRLELTHLFVVYHSIELKFQVILLIISSMAK